MVLLFAALSALIMVKNIVVGITCVPGYDFRLRYHEIECIRRGIDPYDIVTKRIITEEYALFGTPEAKPGVKTLHVYSPWEYTWLLPFSLLKEKTAGALFFLLSVMSLAGIGFFAYRVGAELRGDWLDGVFCASASLFLGYSAGELLAVENFGAINAFLILVLLWLLKKKRHILAGVVWGLLMVKPQIGLLFAIPLLLHRRFITKAIAAGLCLASAIPPAILCGRNPVEMILEVPRGCAFVANENGTMLIPSQLFIRLVKIMPEALPGLISMGIGGGICLLLSWRLRKSESWLVIMFPVVVCALLWSYCKPHDRVILWLTQFVLSILVIRCRNWKVRTGCMILILLSAWPWMGNVGIIAKLMRRVSLFSLLACSWMLPKTDFFNKYFNKNGAGEKQV